MQCSGEHIVKTAPKAFTKDSETCLILNGYPTGTYTAPQTGGWISDFDHVSFTNDVTIVVTDNGNGTSTENIVANY